MKLRLKILWGYSDTLCYTALAATSCICRVVLNPLHRCTVHALHHIAQLVGCSQNTRFSPEGVQNISQNFIRVDHWIFLWFILFFLSCVWCVMSGRVVSVCLRMWAAELWTVCHILWLCAWDCKRQSCGRYARACEYVPENVSGRTVDDMPGLVSVCLRLWAAELWTIFQGLWVCAWECERHSCVGSVEACERFPENNYEEEIFVPRQNLLCLYKS